MDFFYYPFLANSGFLNMSIDKNLFEETKKYNCVLLRFYLWFPPAVSFGKNQKVEEIVNIKECEKNKIDLVRRPTGGRALFHQKELTYFLSGPLDGKIFPKNFQDNYNLISNCLLKGFELLKIPVEIKKSKEKYKTSPLNPIPCFSEPAPGEITFEEKKIVGSAMLVEEEFFLIHGSIIIDFDENLNKKIFKKNENFCVAKLSSILNPLPPWHFILRCFKNGFENFLNKKFSVRNLSKNIIEKSISQSSNYKILKA